MSKVLIITTYWIEKKNGTMTASLFNEEDKYMGENDESRKIYAHVLHDFCCSLLKTESSVIYPLLGIEDNDNAIRELRDLVEEILKKTDFGDEKMRSLFKEDIAKSCKDDLEVDICGALYSLEDNEQLKNLFLPYIAKRNPPLCYYKVNIETGEEYKVIGISSFPKESNTGVRFCNQWIDALINDFTKEGDDVILAMHGSTDWKKANPILGPRKEYSEELSLTMKRKIRVFLFQHYDTDSIAKVLKSNESLPTLWNKLDKEYGASK